MKKLLFLSLLMLLLSCFSYKINHSKEQYPLFPFMTDSIAYYKCDSAKKEFFDENTAQVYRKIGSDKIEIGNISYYNFILSFQSEKQVLSSFYLGQENTKLYLWQEPYFLDTYCMQKQLFWDFNYKVGDSTTLCTPAIAEESLILLDKSWNKRLKDTLYTFKIRRISRLFEGERILTEFKLSKKYGFVDFLVCTYFDTKNPVARTCYYPFKPD